MSTTPATTTRFYIRKKGRAGLVDEFRGDRDFQRFVRPRVARLMGNEAEDGLAAFKKALEASLVLLEEEKLDRLRQEELETLLGTVLETCGYFEWKANSLVRSSLVALATAVSLDAGALGHACRGQYRERGIVAS
jgi:hypothetical protein